MTKILVVAPAWIGDMVMTQSLFKRLHAKHKNLTLDVLAPTYMKDLVLRMPEVNEVIDAPFGHGEGKVRVRRALGKLLREKNYDQAIVTPNSWKSALIPFFANIPERTGWRGEWRYGLLNDIRVLDESKYPLMVQRLMALADSKDAKLVSHQEWWPKLVVDPNHKANVNEQLGIKMDTAQSVLGMCPGAAFGESKRWPAEYFAQVAKQKLTEGWQVWLFGSKEDIPCAQVIQDITQHQCVSFIGRTKLGQAIDILAQCTKVLTNDTGLMHVAAALNIPVVVLYGSSSPGFTPPLTEEATIVQLDLECSPCFERTCPLQHFRCMKELTAQQVLATL